MVKTTIFTRAASSLIMTTTSIRLLLIHIHSTLSRTYISPLYYQEYIEVGESALLRYAPCYNPLPGHDLCNDIHKRVFT